MYTGSIDNYFVHLIRIFPITAIFKNISPCYRSPIRNKVDSSSQSRILSVKNNFLKARQSCQIESQHVEEREKEREREKR